MAFVGDRLFSNVCLRFTFRGAGNPKGSNYQCQHRLLIASIEPNPKRFRRNVNGHIESIPF